MGYRLESLLPESNVITKETSVLLLVIIAFSNGPEERTVGAIALCGVGNRKGSVYWYDLKTEAVFMGDRWTILPAPDIVLERLNQFPDTDDIL